jgi:hypothetical protein
MGKIVELYHKIQRHFQASGVKNGHFALIHIFAIHIVQFKIRASDFGLLHRLPRSRFPNEWSHRSRLFHSNPNKTPFKNRLSFLM